MLSLLATVPRASAMIGKGTSTSRFSFIHSTPLDVRVHLVYGEADQLGVESLKSSLIFVKL